MSAPLADTAPLANTVPPMAKLATPQLLRICLVTEAAGGGVGRHFLDLAAGLAQCGHNVTGIYSPGRCDAQFREKRAAASGVKFVELPLRRAVHPLDLADAWRLTRQIRELGPFDVIHAHSSKGGALARLAARWLRTPAVYTPHAFVTLDPTLSATKRAIYGRIERWLAAQCAAIIAVSEDEAEHARSLGIASAKIHVVPNGIDRPDFPPRYFARAKLGLSADDVAVGFVGRLAPQKAPEVLLAAFASLAPSHQQARLIFVGSGPLEAELRRLAEQRGVAAQVNFVGDVVATQLMPAMDLFCLSSRYEGLPYVLLEALAAGLPIVATSVGGVATCVTADRNGIVVPPDDAAALSNALGRLIENAELRRSFAAASAAMATRFTAEQMVEQTLAVYSQIVVHQPDA